MKNLILPIAAALLVAATGSTAVAQRPIERMLKHDMQNKGDHGMETTITLSTDNPQLW
jgi:hypothetical protein